MNVLILFDYSGKTVRILMDENGDPWWVAKDVCEVLDLKNHRDAVSTLEDKEKDYVGISDAMGRQRLTTIVNEPGLYRMIARSTKPHARLFQNWVYHDVLPSIRKTGQYATQDAPKPPATYLEALQHLIIELKRNEELEAENTEFF